MQTLRCWICYIALIVLGTAGLQASELPSTFFRRNCLDCHSGDAPEGNVNLESVQLDWSQPATSRFLERVLAAIEDNRREGLGCLIRKGPGAARDLS